MKKILISFIAVVFAVFAFAQEIPEKPNPARLVNDFAGVLTESQVEQLEAELVQFNNTTSNQITVVTVPSLNGYQASDFAIRLHEKWQVGQADKNNGIVVLFKPKTAEEKGEVFVSVGYGLEGVIPDAIAHRDVVDFEMIPRFKQGDVFGGLYYGTRVLMELAKGEYTADEYHQSITKRGDSILGGIIFFLIIFIVLPVLLGRKRKYYSGGSSLPFWLLMGLMGSGRSNHSGSWGDFSGGGGGFGGGFGGFGGGSTGGGGAGGSW